MSDKREISEEKIRKIAVGTTIGGVLLIVFLVIILIIQFVQIGVGNSKKKQLDEQISQYEQAIEQGQKDVEFYETGNGLYWYARWKYGFTFDS